MFTLQIIANIILFFTGVFGILHNKRSVLVILMCVELMLLGVNLNFVVASVYLDDFYGQIFALFILTIAAAESAIGLAILILYYRIRGKIQIDQTATLKG